VLLAGATARDRVETDHLEGARDCQAHQSHSIGFAGRPTGDVATDARTPRGRRAGIEASITAAHPSDRLAVAGFHAYLKAGRPDLIFGLSERVAYLEKKRGLDAESSIGALRQRARRFDFPCC